MWDMQIFIQVLGTFFGHVNRAFRKLRFADVNLHSLVSITHNFIKRFSDHLKVFSSFCHGTVSGPVSPASPYYVSKTSILSVVALTVAR